MQLSLNLAGPVAQFVQSIVVRLTMALGVVVCSSVPMFTIEIHTGRLVEARIQALANRERAAAYSDALARAIRSANGERMILCADHRPVVIYQQAVADRLSELFTRMNSQLDRVAILAARSNATLWMQLGRIVREANNPSRQMFDDPVVADGFLAPVLTNRERARLSVFLNG